MEVTATIVIVGLVLRGVYLWGFRNGKKTRGVDDTELTDFSHLID